MPDLAIVPMFAITSSRDMPMPLSAMVTVRAFSSAEMRMRSSGSSLRSAQSVMASKRRRSQASDAFETSSRRKISLLPYKEWIIRWRSWRTSV